MKSIYDRVCRYWSHSLATVEDFGWAAGYPHKAEFGNCLSLDDGQDYAWHDSECDAHYRVICQIN